LEHSVVVAGDDWSVAVALPKVVFVKHSPIWEPTAQGLIDETIASRIPVRQQVFVHVCKLILEPWLLHALTSSHGAMSERNIVIWHDVPADINAPSMAPYIGKNKKVSALVYLLSKATIGKTFENAKP
jgi:hypothetical protein